MTPEVVRIIAAALRHPTTGVVAQLASVPVPEGVTRLTALTILDETTDDVTALKQVPDSLPVLQVMTTSAPMTNPSPSVQPAAPDRRVEVGTRFAMKSASAAAAMEAANQVLRATERSLVALMRADTASKTSNSVLLYHFEEWWTEYGIDNDNTLITATLVCTARCRDRWVSG